MTPEGEELTFGPVFNSTHFLLPLLELQRAVERVTAADGTTFADVCNAPFAPQSGACNVQSLWAYWQDSEEVFGRRGVAVDGGAESGYLDHFVTCSRYVRVGRVE